MKVVSMNAVKRSASLAMVFAILLLSFLAVWAEASPEEEWYRIFGGSDHDYVSSVDQTSDGGYVFTGTTMSWGVGYTDVWLVKTNQAGNLVWNKTFGTNKYDDGASVQQTADDGYIVTGYCNMEGYGYKNSKLWLIKTYADGEMEWNKTFTKISNATVSWSEGRSVAQTSDGGYIVAGSVQPSATPESIWLIKTDAFGNKTWDRVFHAEVPGDSASASSVQQTSDGGYIVAGTKRSYYGGSLEDIWLIKTDMDGTVAWNRTFGKMYGDDPGQEYACAVKQTSDGGYIVAGGSVSSSDYRGWVIKTDALGEQVWEIVLETSHLVSAAQQTTDGKYMIFGHTPGEWFSGCVRLIKVDENGSKLWERLVEDLPHCASVDGLQTSDGGYIVVGHYCPGFACRMDVALVYVTGLIHNLAVTEVVASKSVVGQGCPVNLSLVVLNQGNYTENFNVTIYANTTILSQTEVTLTSGDSTTLTIPWNTTGVAKGNYTITAEATQLPHEIDTTDNTLTDGWIIVAMIGDITGPDGYPDGKCNIRDVALIASKFNVEYPDPRYDPNCDLTGPTPGLPDGKINIRDIALVASHYGENDP